MSEQEVVQQANPKFVETPYVDAIVAPLLDEVKIRVLKKDHDYVMAIDGDEGTGKSVLGMQIGKYLDPNFSLDNVVFTADDFIKKIKDPATKKGTCIMLDEAFSAANARAALTHVNRSMIAVSTEMRQRNLFILILLPSFFDLDRAFAIHRSKALLHVYLDDHFNRGQYVIFPKDLKRELYLVGKKKYSYAWPHSPYPPCRFYNQYVVDEQAYRLKKSQAFTKRTVSNMAVRWQKQRDAYIKYLMEHRGLSQEEVGQIPVRYGADPMDRALISRMMHSENDEIPKENPLLSVIS